VTDRRSRLARSVEHRKRIVVFSVETASGSCSGGSFEVKLGGREGEDEGEEFMEEGFDLGLLGERDDVGAVEEGEDEAGGVEDSLTVIDRVFSETRALVVRKRLSFALREMAWWSRDLRKFLASCRE
jgi:hypothetical protein